uniref:Uncharacterized protein n=1 Tax=Lepeophtheirus salmonis TaxID=72036 RepID=A0A0K2VGI8_LEPSM
MILSILKHFLELSALFSIELMFIEMYFNADTTQLRRHSCVLTTVSLYIGDFHSIS